ncbi:RNA polymerase sigma factor [Nocardiopsis sp. N85]|uniref:RNA polymerase sigma factor n=1 Tax=Nocardiopsis sp. N85 TaxID=3029400 RepID=UPI00237F83B8|nr:RNA polymerase sigma factor [Nocardiopsis sp. N85]MDE3720048.1 RNA polymerase sigma factor [Nocardiopsis sp. N85]
MARDHDGDPPEHAAFNALFERHYDAVYSYARRRVGPDLADDVASEAFVVAWRRREKVPEGRELPWLYACARRITLAKLREVRDRGEVATPPEELWRSSRDDAEQVVHRQAALAALAGLSDTDRELVMLVTWEGLSSREAARVVGCAPVTARGRLHRARRRLRSLMDDADLPENTPDREDASWTTSPRFARS